MPAQSCSWSTSRKNVVCAAKNVKAFPHHGQELDVFELVAPSMIRESGRYMLCVLYSCASSCTQHLRLQDPTFWRNKTGSLPCNAACGMDGRCCDQRHSVPFAACCRGGCFGGGVVVGSAQFRAAHEPAPDGVSSVLSMNVSDSSL